MSLSTAHAPKELNRAGYGLEVKGQASRLAPDPKNQSKFKIPSDDDGEEFLNDWDEWSDMKLGTDRKLAGKTFTATSTL